jgi:anti-anti-sigma factor
VINIQCGSETCIRCFPSGDLDQRAARDLRQVILCALRPGVDVVVDLRLVESIDAAGVGALSDSIRMVRSAGGMARVCNTPARARWRLDLVGIERPLVCISEPEYSGAA